MAVNFNKRTENHSPLMEGRTQIETQDLLGQELTLAAAGIVQTKNGECAVLNWAEYPDRFCFGGVAVTRFIKDLIAQAGDEARLEAECELQKPVFKLIAKKSQKGNRYIDIDNVV